MSKRVLKTAAVVISGAVEEYGKKQGAKKKGGWRSLPWMKRK